jgi:protein tyrosine phosphatase
MRQRCTVNNDGVLFVNVDLKVLHLEVGPRTHRERCSIYLPMLGIFKYLGFLAKGNSSLLSVPRDSKDSNQEYLSMILHDINLSKEQTQRLCSQSL